MADKNANPTLGSIPKVKGTIRAMAIFPVRPGRAPITSPTTQPSSRNSSTMGEITVCKPNKTFDIPHSSFHQKNIAIKRTWNTWVNARYRPTAISAATGTSIFHFR